MRNTFYRIIYATCVILFGSLSVVSAQQSKKPIIVRSVKPETARDANLEAAIFSAVFKNTEPAADDDVHYFYNRVDLNGDNKPEVLVFVVGRTMCGTSGCSAYIFRPDGDSYNLITEFGPARNPIIVSQQKTLGWNDLIMPVSGGGIQPGYYALLKFDGRSYTDNPTVEPAVPLKAGVKGTAYLVGSYSTKSGLALRR